MMRLMLTVLLALLAQGCGRGEEATETAAARPVRVRVVQARRGEISAVLEVTGEVEGLRILRLASPVAGRVTFLAARPGDRIAEGEVAARVVPLESEAALQGFAMLEGAAALGVEERRAVARLRSQSTDIPVRASLPVPPARPLLHAPVRCRIITARHRHALLVPRSALLASSAAARATVMVAAGGAAVRTAVRLGLETATEVEVRRGLAEGD